MILQIIEMAIGKSLNLLYFKVIEWSEEYFMFVL